jgi:hypothetical protein
VPRRKPAEQLTVEGRQVPVSNLEKVLYPESGFTKAQVIDYYIRVSKYLLPHFRSRPVTLKRYPDGVRGEFFYEKDAPAFAPEWIGTFPVPRRTGGPDIRYILINNLASLVWCANAASLELHPFLHCVPHVEQPTFVVFDLDSVKRPTKAKENASALTGRTMEQIAADKNVQWHSNRTSIPGVNLDELPRSEMKFVEPMLAKTVNKLPEGADWQYEIKLDGYRAIAIKIAAQCNCFPGGRVCWATNSLALNVP